MAASRGIATLTALLVGLLLAGLPGSAHGTWFGRLFGGIQPRPMPEPYKPTAPAPAPSPPVSQEGGGGLEGLLGGGKVDRAEVVKAAKELAKAFGDDNEPGKEDAKKPKKSKAAKAAAACDDQDEDVKDSDE